MPYLELTKRDDMFKVLGVILVLGLLSGCSIKSPLENLEHYDGKTAALQVSECRQWLAGRDAMEDAQIANLDGDLRAFSLMHRQTMRMIETTFGKDPCAPGSNVWDAYMVYAREQGETNRTAWDRSTNLIGTALKVTGAVVVAGELTDMVSDINKNAGSTYDVEGDWVGRDKADVRSFGEGSAVYSGSTNTATETTTVTETVTDSSYNQE